MSSLQETIEEDILRYIEVLHRHYLKNSSVTSCIADIIYC
jgi:hypothetical protein